MKKVPLQLKLVSNPKPKEKNPLGTAYLNILKQQTSNIKVLKPDLIFKRYPPNNESSPKNFPDFTTKSDNKLKNRKEIEREQNKDENSNSRTPPPTCSDR